MEIDIELYSNENKENRLRKKISGNTLQSMRPCLADITHKFMPEKQPAQPSKNVGLFKFASGGNSGGSCLKMKLPR